jgi:hypothetical protein
VKFHGVFIRLSGITLSWLRFTVNVLVTRNIPTAVNPLPTSDPKACQWPWVGLYVDRASHQSIRDNEEKLRIDGIQKDNHFPGGIDQQIETSYWQYSRGPIFRPLIAAEQAIRKAVT